MLRFLALSAFLAMAHGESMCSTLKKKECKKDKYHDGQCYLAKLKRGECLSDGTCHPENHKKKKGKYCVETTVVLGEPEPESSSSESSESSEGTMIPITTLTWQIVDDNVMGGKSSSRMVVDGDSMNYSGYINLNGGGFVSTRTNMQRGYFSGYSSVKVAATLYKGTNTMYKLSFSTPGSDYYRTDTYQNDMEFTVGLGQRQEFVLHFSDFIPSWRGYVTGGPGIDDEDLAKITELGLSMSYLDMNGKKIPGFVSESFEIVFHSIELM